VSARCDRAGLLAVLAAVLLGACASAPPDTDSGRPDPLAVPGRVLVGNLLLDGVPEIPERITSSLARYNDARSAFFRGWLGDGVLVSTRFGNTYQLHRVDSPGAARRQLTFFDEPVTTAWVPPVAEPAGLVYARDSGGSEFYQLFYLDLASGDSRLLSDGRSRYDDVRWNRSGDRFAYTTTERNGRNWDLHAQDLAGNREVLLESEVGAWAVLDWSPDGERLLVLQYLSVNESNVFELRRADGRLTPLLDESLSASVTDARYAADGRAVFFSADIGAEFVRLHRLDLDSGRLEVLSADVSWDVEAFELSPDGRFLAMVFNEGGPSRLRVRRLGDDALLALPEVPVGIVDDLAFSVDGSRLAFSLNRATASEDAYSLDLADRRLTRWTRSELGGLDEEQLVAPTFFDYPTFDRVDGAARRIPAQIYTPRGPGPHPVLVNIHGGPESQYRPFFSVLSQYLVRELGVAVIAPNVRGSRGYGKSYLKLDDGRLREDSVKDIGALLDWVDRQGHLDGDRVAVLGGSYGGYMVLASMIRFGDRLAAGVESVGISNFVTFLENTQEYRRDLRRVEYGDERDPAMRAFLERISPLNRADEIRRPMMISQGYNDPRVPASESEQIVAALKAGEVPVWYVLALDEGHGFAKKTNRDFNATATMAFLERYLLGAGAAAAAATDDDGTD